MSSGNNDNGKGRLEDRVAVATGGNSGIGLASALAFREKGARVVIFGRNRDTLDEAARQLGEDTLAVQGDVNRMEDLDRLMAAVAETHGRIDVLLVDAGVAPMVPLDQVDEDHFDKLIDINFKGAFFTVQKALSHLREGASVILVSSAPNQMGMAGTSVYSATKAAVRSLSRSLSAELASRGIRVNTLSPGPIETPLLERTGLKPEEMEGFAEAVREMVPMGRFGRSGEMARAALFLASNDSSYMAGADLVADGGISQI